MAIWHAIKGQQKGVIDSVCVVCGKKIRIYPSEPKICSKCLMESNRNEASNQKEGIWMN